MSARRSRIACAVVLGALFFVPPAVGADACPASDVYLLGPDTLPIAAATYDTTLSENGGITAHAAFDVGAGTLAAIHGELYPGQTSVTVHDSFDIAGLPAGTPVTVTAELVADGEITTTGCGGAGCGGSVYASIATAGELAEQLEGGILFAPGTRPEHLVVRLPVTLTAGTPQPIAFRVYGARGPGGNHRAELAGAYRFLDLPPGASVVSCRGFVQSPTPARPASWGRVKAAYR